MFSPRFSSTSADSDKDKKEKKDNGDKDKKEKKDNGDKDKKEKKDKADMPKAKESPAAPAAPATPEGGVNRGRGARMMERKAMLRQPKAADSGATGSPGDRIHRLEQALALYRASANVDHHLGTIFRLRKELRENRAKANALRTPELVQAAKAVLVKTASFCPQGCPLLEDYQRLKKEISFYLK